MLVMSVGVVQCNAGYFVPCLVFRVHTPGNEISARQLKAPSYKNIGLHIIFIVQPPPMCVVKKITYICYSFLNLDDMVVGRNLCLN